MPAADEGPESDRQPVVESKEALNERSIALMAEIGQGNAEAFRELVELHQGAVIGTCAKMVGDLDDAHDLAQKIFLRIWKSAPRYEPKAKFTTWLFTIVRNQVFNHTRSNRRAKLISIDSDDHPGILKDVEVDSGDSPESQLLKSELIEAIDEAIQQLPENQRLAVILRRYEDLSYEEIATSLETSVSAVKSLLFRARAQLREALSLYIAGEPPD